MLKTQQEIRNWLFSQGILNYSIHYDLTVNVKGLVNLSNQSLTEIPIQFGQVEGDFYCANNQLKTLKGSPHTVLGNFLCENNLLESYQDLPKKINKILCCSGKINLEELIKLELEGSFRHTCKNVQDKLSVFMDKYEKSTTKVIPTYTIKLTNDEFNEMMLSYKEKAMLESRMNHPKQSSNKLKV